MSSLNLEIKQAIDSFDIDRARKLLSTALKEANAETYYLASMVALNNQQKLEFLDKALELDPHFEKAFAELDIQTRPPEVAQTRKVKPALFRVVLVEAGSDKLGVMKAMRLITQTMSLKEAEQAIESKNYTIIAGVNSEAAYRAKSQLDAAGAEARIEEMDW